MTPTGQVLFIQGGGAGAHDEWDDKLVESLRRELGGEYEVRYPRMPERIGYGGPAKTLMVLVRCADHPIAAVPHPADA